MADPRWERIAAGKPQDAYAFIQWKGTDVCADLHCLCGEHGHYDGDFMYRVRCRGCGQLYDVGCFVALVPVPKAEENPDDEEALEFIDGQCTAAPKTGGEE